MKKKKGLGIKIHPVFKGRQIFCGQAVKKKTVMLTAALYSWWPDLVWVLQQPTQLIISELNVILTTLLNSAPI